MQQLPAIYFDAGLRNVTPVCPDRRRIGLGFDMDDLPVRVALTLADAVALRTTLDDYISSFAATQSPGSALSPSVSVSVPSEGVKT
jgi:hypothetical protein